MKLIFLLLMMGLTMLIASQTMPRVRLDSVLAVVPEYLITISLGLALSSLYLFLPG